MAILLFTDFGQTDLYVGQVKAVIGQQAPGVQVIDLLNEAPAFNISASAHLLSAMVAALPQESVILAVVDPGVGSARHAVVVEAAGHRFVGPDNGLLSVVCARASEVLIQRISWRPERLSASFHGRDLFAPVAARLAAGTLGAEDLQPQPRLDVEFGACDLGEIIYIDHYGNAMSGLRAAGLSTDTVLQVRNRHVSYARVFSEATVGEAFWYANSMGLVEIAVNQGQAAKALGLAIGDTVAPL